MIYDIEQGAFGRYVIVSTDDRTMAWTGSQWAPHYRGVPLGSAQICNFETSAEADRYARNHPEIGTA